MLVPAGDSERRGTTVPGMAGGWTKRTLRAVALTTAICALTCTSTAAAAEPGWTEPLDLSPGYLYTYPQIAPDQDGGYVHTWDEMIGDRWPIFATTVPASGPATPTQTLDGRTFRGADIAGDGRGTVLAAWQEVSAECCVTLSAAVKQPGETLFGETIEVDYGGGWVGQPKVAMNERGRAVMVFGVGEDGDAQLRAVFRSPAGVFSPPVRVTSQSEEGIWDFQLDLSDNGEAVVSWSSEHASGKHAVRAAVGSQAGFDPPVTLSDPSRHAFDGGAAIDAAGGAMVIFDYSSTEDRGEVPIMVAVREPGSSFGEPFEVGRGVDGPSPDAAVSDDGRGLVSFIDENHEPTIRPVNTRDSALGARTTIDALTGWIRLTVSDDGRALVGMDSVLMLVFGSDGATPSPVLAAWGNVDGDFGPARAVSCGERWLRLSDITLGLGGTGAVMLHEHAEDESGADDRTLISRSDPSAEPLDQECRETSSGPPLGLPSTGAIGPTPSQSGPASISQPAPRVSLQLPRRLTADRSGRFRVSVLGNVPGEIDVEGRARIAGREYRLRGKSSRMLAPGIDRMRLRPASALAQRLADGETPRAKLVATLEAEGGDARDRGRTKLQFDGSALERR